MLSTDVENLGKNEKVLVENTKITVKNTTYSGKKEIHVE